MVTHDREMVDKMRKRAIALDAGRLIRDERRGGYAEGMTKIRSMVLAEALKSIGANVSTTVASAVSVLIGMFLIGVFIGLGTWLVSWSDDSERELAVHLPLPAALPGRPQPALPA